MQWIRHILPFITATHRLLFRFTRGGLGGGVFGWHFLQLEHVGRKSGQLRKTPLLYIEDGDRFVVVASNAGQDRHPAWWLNLQTTPEALVTANGESAHVVARRATTEEAARLWVRLEESYRWFGEYRAGTERDIPIVVLEPTSPRRGERWREVRTWFDRVAVVTGAASGVGRALSQELAIRGCRLALVDVNAEGLEEVARQLRAYGTAVTTHVADVSDPVRMQALPEEILAEHEHIHVLVNNAGVTVIADFEDHSLEELQWLVGINLWGVLHGCHFFLPYLQREEEARLVNLSSATGSLGFPGHSAYAATKAGVRALSEALHGELSIAGNVHVTSVHPGGIRTGLFEAARGAKASDIAKVSKEPESARFFRSPEQVAKKIVRAVERKRVRVLVGWDAYAIEGLWRLSPSLAIRTMGWLHRAQERADGEPIYQHVEVTHRYEASPQAVWDVYTDHARWSEWAGTPESRLVTPGHPDANGVGAVRGFAGGMREEVLSFEPPKRMTYAIVAGLFPVKDHEGEVLFEAEHGGTVVTWCCRFRPKIPGTGALLRRIVIATFRRSLEGLERHSFS